MDELGERQQIVARVVRRGIERQPGRAGRKYSIAQASRDWHVSMPTLNRLLRDGNVGLPFYRAAERGLGLPEYLFDLIIDGEANEIHALPDLDRWARDFILREMGAETVPQRRRKSQ